MLHSNFWPELEIMKQKDWKTTLTIITQQATTTTHQQTDALHHSPFQNKGNGFWISASDSHKSILSREESVIPGIPAWSANFPDTHSNIPALLCVTRGWGVQIWFRSEIQSNDNTLTWLPLSLIQDQIAEAQDDSFYHEENLEAALRVHSKRPHSAHTIDPPGLKDRAKPLTYSLKGFGSLDTLNACLCLACYEQPLGLTRSGLCIPFSRICLVRACEL